MSESTRHFQRLCARLDSLTGEMIEFQKTLTAIPALSPINGGEGEWDRAEFLKLYLSELESLEITQIDAPDDRAKCKRRPNLLVFLPGKSSERTVWFMSHMDVVPEGDTDLWNSDPWTVVHKNGRLYGRGTEDNQQGLTSSVFTVKAFLDEGIVPEFRIGLILAADEETGSDFGLKYILQNHFDLFGKNDLIIVPDAGESDSRMIEVAEKSIVWIRFQVKGKQCHASLPSYGINAFAAGSSLVVALKQLDDIFDSSDPVFVPPTSTFAPTKKEANVPNVNTIPGEDVFHLDCRLLPEYRVSELFNEVRAICDQVERAHDVEISFDTTQCAEAAPPTPVDASVVSALQSGIKQVYNVDAVPMGIGGGTVAGIFRSAGLPVAVWSTLDDVCHQPNEYCVVEYMVNDAKVFAHVCLNTTY